MAKTKTIYICNQCEAVHNGWVGKCSACGSWNTLQEQTEVISGSRAEKAIRSGKKLTTISFESEELKIKKPRMSTAIKDIDEVFGGGLVAGSVILIAGQPGIGKSTLLLQIAYNLSKLSKVLYVSGEESPQQIAIRGKRLKTIHQNLHLASSNSANDIALTIDSSNYDVVIVDSIQTVSTEEANGVAGSISQVTNSAQILMMAAKRTNTALILVGHVNKEGSIAGPKVLEHVVDVVLQLEGDRYGGFRVLRCGKNRFGSTNEAAILEMLDNGLQVVDNPSAALLAERQKSDGSVVLATMEGARPILVEVQALVNTTTYGYPKRAAVGIDINRLNILIAMLERRTKLRLADKDIYVNIVGGVKITEPAVDLAICMAIASATKGMQIKKDAVVFGEVGLSGEVRHVNYTEKRLGEALKLGFRTAIGPKNRTDKPIKGLCEISDIRMALNTYLTK
jgi:DNA repair protein RadA/Sms